MTTKCRLLIGQDVPPCGPLSLDGCRASLLSSSEVLIVTREGTFYILTLLLEKANNTVTELFLSKVGSYVQAEVVSCRSEVPTSYHPYRRLHYWITSVYLLGRVYQIHCL